MISRVQWLKNYEQYNACGSADISFCNKYHACQGCPYNNIACDEYDLLNAAAEIFNAQVIANGRLEDDGK